ncbi:alpha-amylase-like [Dendroctonus ponderosae]
MKIFGAIAVLVLGVVSLSSAANINLMDGETGLRRAFKWISSEWDELVDDVKNGTVPKEVVMTAKPTTKNPTETIIDKRSVEPTLNTSTKPIKTRVIRPTVEWTEKPTKKPIGKPVGKLTETYVVENGTVVTKLTVKPTVTPTEKPTGKPITTTTKKLMTV